MRPCTSAKRTPTSDAMCCAAASSPPGFKNAASHCIVMFCTWADSCFTTNLPRSGCRSASPAGKSHGCGLSPDVVAPTSASRVAVLAATPEFDMRCAGVGCSGGGGKAGAGAARRARARLGSDGSAAAVPAGTGPLASVAPDGACLASCIVAAGYAGTGLARACRGSLILHQLSQTHENMCFLCGDAMSGIPAHLSILEIRLGLVPPPLVPQVTLSDAAFAVTVCILVGTQDHAKLWQGTGG